MKKICLVLLIAIASTVCGDEEKGETRLPLEGKNCLFVIAHRDFRDEELLIPKNMLEEAGATITIASTDTTSAKGMLGATIKPDIFLKDAKIENYVAIILIGGIGSKDYWENKVVHKLLKDADEKDKVIGAICLAPVTLANAGLLKGKNATCYETKDTKKIFEKSGVKYTKNSVEVDGKVITANGPKAAKEFAKKIMGLLLSEDSPSES